MEHRQQLMTLFPSFLDYKVFGSPARKNLEVFLKTIEKQFHPSIESNLYTSPRLDTHLGTPFNTLRCWHIYQSNLNKKLLGSAGCLHKFQIIPHYSMLYIFGTSKLILPTIKPIDRSFWVNYWAGLTTLIAESGHGMHNIVLIITKLPYVNFNRFWQTI